MTIEQLLNEPLTLDHRGRASTDAYGNDVVGTTASEEIVGYVEQTDSTEIIVDRETYIANYRAFLPAATSIGAGDRITDPSGKTYEVIGPPDDMYNPRLQKSSHIVARLRVTTG